MWESVCGRCEMNYQMQQATAASQVHAPCMPMHAQLAQCTLTGNVRASPVAEVLPLPLPSPASPSGWGCMMSDTPMPAHAPAAR